jgi:hypothetical protein
VGQPAPDHPALSLQVAQENPLSPIPAIHHMAEGIWILEAEFAGHDGSLKPTPKPRQLSKVSIVGTDPFTMTCLENRTKVWLTHG